MIQKRINEKKGLAVFFNLNYEITSLFKLLGFDKVFTITDDRADALNILDRHVELSPPEVSSQNSDALFVNNDFSTDIESELSTPEVQPAEEFTESDNNENIFEPFVIECIKCRSLIRIKEAGEQLCPYCSADFIVNNGKKAVFRIKEIHSIK